jgi:hypothetical protein
MRRAKGSPLPEAAVSEAAKPDVAKPKAGKSEVSRPVRRLAKPIKSEPIEVSPEIEVKEWEPCILKRRMHHILVLRIRDVYPRSGFFHLWIQSQKCTGS